MDTAVWYRGISLIRNKGFENGWVFLTKIRNLSKMIVFSLQK